MTEIVERVARAIDQCEMPDGDPFGVVVGMSDYVEGNHSVLDICKIVARAAIAAMPGEPVAWIDRADNGNIRFWTADPERAEREREAGRDLHPYTMTRLVSLANVALQATVLPAPSEVQP